MPERRFIVAGMVYTSDEDVELDTPDPNPDPPPEELRGEPMGWTKAGERPRGFADLLSNPRYQNSDDPGPFDGRWERDE